MTLPNLEKLSALKWSSLRLKVPVVFRQNDSQFIIREMKNIRGLIMVELCMDDDRAMANITTLPDHVQAMIDNHLKLQAA